MSEDLHISDIRYEGEEDNEFDTANINTYQSTSILSQVDHISKISELVLIEMIKEGYKKTDFFIHMYMCT